MTQRSVQGAIGEFVQSASADWLAPARSAAALSICDTLAVAFAAHNTPIVQKVRQFASTEATGSKVVPLWGVGDGALPELAALFNGVAAHALDFDDVATAWRGHPSAVLLPALAAVSSIADDATGLLDAYIVGYEVGAALGRAIIKHHYGIGWHSTSTIGVIAATAACCRLLNYNPSMTANAIGLAVAQAGGLQANFGTDAKALQAGFASAAAVRATLLARVGVTSGGSVMEGPAGFESLYGGSLGRLNAEIDSLGKAGPVLVGGTEIKVFPTCYATHRALAAASKLRSGHSFTLEEITSIKITGTPGSHTPLRNAPPLSPDEAKFHIATCVGLILTKGSISLNDFADGRFASAPVKHLASLANVEECDFGRPGRIARVSISLGERTIAAEVEQLPRVDWTDATWIQKLCNCLAVTSKSQKDRCVTLALNFVGAGFERCVHMGFGLPN
ncbi:MmgE/PrpD family protein [Aminobacter sp. J44]|uniref:MmgE/PrpD family protein n=1 Tax=Aminobacter sp. J44 TaxID=935262 RepID=UPI00119990E1|nr:MmgE/PrpD family protein [Aminobacter sp. J44]TWG53211.1 2-methylcitrate dehydratase PrpD [Aminobacter sp. J44]